MSTAWLSDGLVMGFQSFSLDDIKLKSFRHAVSITLLWVDLFFNNTTSYGRYMYFMKVCRICWNDLLSVLRTIGRPGPFEAYRPQTTPGMIVNSFQPISAFAGLNYHSQTESCRNSCMTTRSPWRSVSVTRTSLLHLLVNIIIFSTSDYKNSI